MINPNNGNSQLYRGNVYQNHLNYTIALSDYQRAIKLNPKHTDVILKCGIILWEIK